MTERDGVHWQETICPDIVEPNHPKAPLHDILNLYIPVVREALTYVFFFLFWHMLRTLTKPMD